MTNEKTSKGVALGFERESVVVPLAHLMPLKVMRPGTKDSQKYAQILTSVRAVGLVEAPAVAPDHKHPGRYRSEEHTSELQSLMRISYAVFCLKQNRT